MIQQLTEKEKTCDELREAIDNGKMGDIVAKHEKLILQYYEDVQRQAKQSFNSAKFVAQIGFWVLIVTLTYALVFDALNRFQKVGLSMKGSSLTVAGVGVVSGILIESIAGINFWLYARGARQFSAFHICLERTHRYLLAYKIASEIKEDKDKTVASLVCIMANAPMITQDDIDSTRSEAAKGQLTKTVSTEFKKL
jgi:hypothetical protein